MPLPSILGLMKETTSKASVLSRLNKPKQVEGVVIKRRLGTGHIEQIVVHHIVALFITELLVVTRPG